MTASLFFLLAKILIGWWIFLMVALWIWCTFFGDDDPPEAA